MWTVIKFDKKKINLFKEDFKNKIDNEFELYIPKIRLLKRSKNRLVKKEFNLLDNYLFCYTRRFQNSIYLNKLNYLKGVKFFLGGTAESQSNISLFISNCKKSEDENGFISNKFFNIKENKSYQFSSGILDKYIFELLELKKNKIKVLIGSIKTTIERENFLFKPILK